MNKWSLANNRAIDLSTPKLMAILNATPDSFSDGGKHDSVDAAVRAAHRFAQEGATAIDIGGESTRPGAQPVDAQEQIRRTIPVIKALRADRGFDALAISIDTTWAKVASAALDAGADAVNDVSGLQDDSEAMMQLLNRSSAGYVLMHRLRAPATDSYSDRYERAPEYANVVEDVRNFLAAKLALLESAGVRREKILLDPGLGFGKTVEQNLELIRGTPELLKLGRPILSGLSRKSFVGRHSLGRDSQPSERLAGTLKLSAEHLRFGARLFRVHDVEEHAKLLLGTPGKRGE